MTQKSRNIAISDTPLDFYLIRQKPLFTRTEKNSYTKKQQIWHSFFIYFFLKTRIQFSSSSQISKISYHLHRQILIPQNDPQNGHFCCFSLLKIDPRKTGKNLKKHDFNDFYKFKTRRFGHNIRFLTPQNDHLHINSKVLKPLFLGLYGGVRGVLNTSLGQFATAPEQFPTAVAKKW